MRFTPKSDADRYYFTDSGNIYADRVADFVCECDSHSGGLVIDRLSRVFDYVFVDEVQDCAGYDLNFLDRLFGSTLSVTAVGDPRQATFSTNRSSKNKKFKKKHVIDWIRDREISGVVTVEVRCECYRSNQVICDFADALFPDFGRTTSKNVDPTGHDGVFLIKAEEVHDYVAKHNPVVLRYDKRANTMNLAAWNIGLVKGKTFDRVLIFPTNPMESYLRTGDLNTAGDVSKLYVAVTRARHSAAFVIGIHDS